MEGTNVGVLSHNIETSHGVVMAEVVVVVVVVAVTTASFEKDVTINGKS